MYNELAKADIRLIFYETSREQTHDDPATNGEESPDIASRLVGSPGS